RDPAATDAACTPAGRSICVQADHPLDDVHRWTRYPAVTAHISRCPCAADDIATTLTPPSCVRSHSDQPWSKGLVQGFPLRSASSRWWSHSAFARAATDRGVESGGTSIICQLDHPPSCGHQQCHSLLSWRTAHSSK